METKKSVSRVGDNKYLYILGKYMQIVGAASISAARNLGEQSFYLHYVNDYLTVDKICEHYGIEKELANSVIDNQRKKLRNFSYEA